MKKKNIKFILVLLLPVLFLSCGFKPINQKNGNLIHFKEIEVKGDQRTAYSLKNELLLISNKDSINKQNIRVIISKQKSTKIKDKSGKVTRYDLSLSANVKLTKLSNNQIKEKIFSRNLDYYVSSIHSDTIKNESNAAKIIAQQLLDDITSYIILSSKRK